MARKHLITHIRSAIPGKTPTTASLALGEFGINTNDGKVYIHKSGSGGDKIVHLITTDSVTTGSIIISGSLTTTGSIIGTVKIGDPDDGTYTDGFFDTFSANTNLANAIDEISEAFLDLAPAKAGILTGENLTRINPSVFSGYLADGLNSEWYVGYVAGNLSSVLTAATTVDLDSPSQGDTFRAGKNSDITASLEGGVSASRAYGSDPFTVIDTKSLASGVGSSGIIEIETIQQYNTFWAMANARINDTITATGSVKWKMSADNSAGETDEYQLLYVGTITDFPNASFLNSPTSSVTTEVNKYLSGIAYYGNGTDIDIMYAGQNLFNPVYSANQTRIESSYFINLNVNTLTPDYYDNFYVTQSLLLSSNVQSSYGNVGIGTVRLYKPNKSTVSSNFNIGSKAINTYGVRSTTLLEYFDDEDKRYESYNSSSWTVTDLLPEFQLQVQNGRLIDGRYGNYTGFSGSIHYYYRPFTPTNANQNGTITIDRTDFSSFVEEWDGSGELQAAFYINSENGSTIYDLGRAVGNNSGNIYGIRNSISGELIDWALPAGKQTSNGDPLILVIKYNSAESTDYITQLTVTFDV